MSKFTVFLWVVVAYATLWLMIGIALTQSSS